MQIKSKPTTSLLRISDLLKDDLSKNNIEGQMKCDCCQHSRNCPIVGDCYPKTILSKKSIVSSPNYLLIQVSRCSSDGVDTIHSTIWPDDQLTLPSGEMYQ